ncbi:hypothetical protein TYRP_020994 [Tyrophagus putrescentiae]|nr:hypothetical protein TYRP_020994 [Tyrophagus putrescentiae]
MLTQVMLVLSSTTNQSSSKLDNDDHHQLISCFSPADCALLDQVVCHQGRCTCLLGYVWSSSEANCTRMTCHQAEECHRSWPYSQCNSSSKNTLKNGTYNGNGTCTCEKNSTWRELSHDRLSCQLKFTVLLLFIFCSLLAFFLLCGLWVKGGRGSKVLKTGDH